jgi:glycosyltransferase involved in cell wall biosynthesis
MFGYQPNRIAAAFLIDDLFPRLANIYHDCQLTLAGSWPTAHMLQAAKRDPRIVVTGTVSDMRCYLTRASAMVVPLFQGSGTRFKILEAFALAVPVVSTAKGAEGLDVENGKHLLVAESAGEFVESLQRLWTTPSLAKHLTESALQLVKREYSWEAASLRIGQAVDELRESKLRTSTVPAEARYS